jgi:hypothetical protein
LRALKNRRSPPSLKWLEMQSDIDANWLRAQICSVNVRELKKKVSGGGFRPFEIRTTNGQKFQIPHPEFILFGKYSIAVVDKEGYINEIDPLHVVSARSIYRRNGGS